MEVQLLVLHRTTQETHLCLRVLSKPFLNSGSLGAATSPWEPGPVPNHCLGDEHSPYFQCKRSLTQLRATHLCHVSDHGGGKIKTAH